MNQRPLISVVMPVFKVERYVAKAIQSVIEQSMADWELILVDDASPDASAEIIAGFADRRIRHIRHAQSLGPAIARNTAIQTAQGDYIALLDSDDIAHPDRLAKQFEFLENNPQAGLVGCWAELISEAGQVTGLRRNPYPNHLLSPMLVFRNTFITSSLTIRKAAIPSTMFGAMLAEDYDFVSRLAERWDIAVLPETLIQYRLNSQGLMGTRWQQIKADCWATQLRLLEQLGIEPTATEAQLHQRISHAVSDGITSSEAERAGPWLEKIIAANDRSARYERDQLRQVCSEILMSLWRCAASEGFAAVFKARSAMAAFGQPPGLGQMARLAARAWRAG